MLTASYLFYNFFHEIMQNINFTEYTKFAQAYSSSRGDADSMKQKKELSWFNLQSQIVEYLVTKLFA